MTDRRLAERLAALLDHAATPVDQHVILSGTPELVSVVQGAAAGGILHAWIGHIGQFDPNALDAIRTQGDLALIGDFGRARLVERAAEIGVAEALAEHFGPYQAPV